MLNVQQRIVDPEGRPTRPFVHLMQSIVGQSATGLEGRVTALESSVGTLQGQMSALSLVVSAQTVSILANTAAISAATASISAQAILIGDLQMDDMWVSPWP